MDYIRFASIIGKLKTIKRTGWVNAQVPQPESVSDHSFRVAVLTMLLAPKMEVNEEKAIKMALIHDLGESIMGDLVTVGAHKEISLEEKEVKEKAAFRELITSTNAPEEYQALFEEYNANKTPEAHLVKQIDKLETLLQAAEYESAHGVSLEHFQTNRGNITDPYLKSLLTKIEKIRPQK